MQPERNVLSRKRRRGTLIGNLSKKGKVLSPHPRSNNMKQYIPYGQKIETAQRRQRSNIFGLGPVLRNKLAVDA